MGRKSRRPPNAKSSGTRTDASSSVLMAETGTLLKQKIAKLEDEAHSNGSMITAAEDKELALLDEKENGVGFLPGDSDDIGRDFDAFFESVGDDGRIPATMIQAARQKYISVVEQSRELSQKNKWLDERNRIQRRRGDRLSEEVSLLTKEAQKSRQTREKLEALCRELQRQNKSIIENTLKASEEDRRRTKEMSEKFKETIDGVTVQLEAQDAQRVEQFKESEDLRRKLLSLLEKFDLREQQFETQLKTKGLELKLATAKLEKQIDMSEREKIKADAHELQISTLVATENELRKLVALYAEKFDTFQGSLTTSNEKFQNLKMNLSQMGAAKDKLEREGTKLKRKNESNEVKIFQLVDQQQNAQKENMTLRNQKGKLEGLCRTLQQNLQQQRGVAEKLAEKLAAKLGERGQKEEAALLTGPTGSSSSSCAGTAAVPPDAHEEVSENSTSVQGEAAEDALCALSSENAETTPVNSSSSNSTSGGACAQKSLVVDGSGAILCSDESKGADVVEALSGIGVD